MTGMTGTNGTNELHVAFGANGQIGTIVTRELAARGMRVRAVTRSGTGDFPAGVEAAKADATNRAEVLAAAQGATAIYHTLNAPYTEKDWAHLLPIYMDNLIAAASETGALLAYMDNLYMYGAPDGPMTEASPVRPIEGKGRTRAAVAETLLDAHTRGTVRATVGRAGNFFGPAALNSITGMFVFANAAAGKGARWPASLDQPHTSSYTEDVGRGLVVLGTHPDQSAGEVFHIPADAPLTGRQFVALVGEESGAPLKASTLSPIVLKLAGLFIVGARESAKMAYQFDRPYVMDGAKFARTFGGSPTPHREAIRATLAWFRQQATAKKAAQPQGAAA